MPIKQIPTQHLLRDYRLDLMHSELRPVYEVETAYQSMPKGQGRRRDFATIDGGENLGQALLMRILTPRGELARLGHPEYGSRVHEIIGSGNTDTTRNLLKLFIIEAVQREPRVEEIIEIKISPAPGLRDSVDVSLMVKAIGFVDTIHIGPFTLNVG